MNGTIRSGSCSGSIHFHSRNSGLAVAMLTSLSSPRKRARYQSWSCPFHLPPHNLPANLLGQIVLQPLGAFGDPLDQVRRDAGLFLQLAQRGRPRLLALVDPALRHLPGLVGIIDARARRTPCRPVQQHHADPAAVAIWSSSSFVIAALAASTFCRARGWWRCRIDSRRWSRAESQSDCGKQAGDDCHDSPLDNRRRRLPRPRPDRAARRAPRLGLGDRRRVRAGRHGQERPPRQSARDNAARHPLGRMDRRDRAAVAQPAGRAHCAAASAGHPAARPRPPLGAQEASG